MEKAVALEQNFYGGKVGKVEHEKGEKGEPKDALGKKRGREVIPVSAQYPPEVQVN